MWMEKWTKKGPKSTKPWAESHDSLPPRPASPVFGRSPGAAGLCFHVHVAKNTGLYGYVFYLRFSPGDVQHGELVLAKLGPDDSAYDAPEDVVILSPKTAITQGCVVKVVDEGQKALKGHRGLVMEVYESWGTTCGPHRP